MSEEQSLETHLISAGVSKETVSNLKLNPNLFADVVALVQLLMSSASNPGIQAILVALSKLWSDLLTGHLAAANPDLKGIGPGTVMEAMGVFSDLSKYAKTPEGAAIVAACQLDCQKVVDKAQSMATSDQGKAVIQRITKLISDLGISLPSA